MKTTIPPVKNSGFTFIEVIMVIVIIGILSAIVIPQYHHMKERASKGAYYGVKQALEAHAAQIYAGCAAQGRARYPSSASILISGSGKGDCMEEGMPDSGFKVTVLSDTQISIKIDGITQNYSYNPLGGKVSGEYN